MTDISSEIPKIIIPERRKSPITPTTKEWTSELDTQLPIQGEDIPDFKAWINWNGFQLNRRTAQGHDGFDFAAYLTTDNRIVFGLPPDTKIRAVADGVVRQFLNNEFTGGGYGAELTVEHGADGSGMFSCYVHTRVFVEEGTQVKKGDVIAELYKDEGYKVGRLVHLHLMLVDGWGTHGSGWQGGLPLRVQNPRLIDDSIYNFAAEPQGLTHFKVPQLPSVKIEIANFEELKEFAISD